MALAEARAAWQRAASRCFVQEDAKRTPRLACCSSLAPFQEPDLRPSDSARGREIAPRDFMPLDQEPAYHNLSTSSQWWMHLQKGYGYQNRLINEKLSEMDGYDETSDLKEVSQDFLGSESDFVIDEQTSAESILNDQFFVKEAKNICNDPLKLDEDDHGRNAHDGGVKAVESTPGSYFDSESFEKSGPWWRNADAEELALLVAQRSGNLIENCDLPLPQNDSAKTYLCTQTTSSYRSQAFNVSKQQDLVQPPNHLFFSDPPTGNTASESFYRKHRSPSEREYCYTDGEVGKMDGDTSQILDALHHCQTRARESDNIAKQACEEKEHIVKLLLRQASHLFAYKQWLRILQLENNTYLLAIRSKSQPTFPVIAPWKPMRRRSRMNTTRKKPHNRRSGCSDIGKYAVVFAFGLGFIGVGLMLGWSMAWMPLPCDTPSL